VLDNVVSTSCSLFSALKPLYSVVEFGPETFGLLKHLVPEGVKVIPVGAEERVLPEKVPQGNGNVTLARLANVTLILSHLFVM